MSATQCFSCGADPLTKCVCPREPGTERTVVDFFHDTTSECVANFERGIEVRRAEGYRLDSWKMDRIDTKDGWLDVLIVAVFVLVN